MHCNTVNNDMQQEWTPAHSQMFVEQISRVKQADDDVAIHLL